MAYETASSSPTPQIPPEGLYSDSRDDIKELYGAYRPIAEPVTPGEKLKKTRPKPQSSRKRPVPQSLLQEWRHDTSVPTDYERSLARQRIAEIREGVLANIHQKNQNVSTVVTPVRSALGALDRTVELRSVQELDVQALARELGGFTLRPDAEGIPVVVPSWHNTESL